MKKIDLRKELKNLYTPSAKQVQIVDVPEFNFLMIDGAIEAGMQPDNSPLFQCAIEAMYGLAYSLKFASKLRKTHPIDYTVMPLEGMWSLKTENVDSSRKDNWKWRLLLLQPDHITPEMFEDARRQMKSKKDNPVFPQVRLERFHEGLCLQIMHIGPYADEPRSFEKLEKFAAENGYRLSRPHHEIYLGDPRRAKPERLKTILRHQIVAVSER